MKIGIFSTQIGTGGTGPEVIDRNIIRVLSQTDRENSYALFCIRDVKPDSLGIDGADFRVRTLKPQNKWAAVSFGVSLELAARACRRPACDFRGAAVHALPVRLYADMLEPV